MQGGTRIIDSFANSRAKIFFAGNLAFIAGVALASYFPAIFVAGWELVWFCVMAGLAVALVFLWKRPRARLGLLAFAFLFFGIWRYTTGIPDLTPDNIAYYNGRTVTVAGVVAGEPDVRERSTKYEVRSKKLEVRDNEFFAPIFFKDTTDKAAGAEHEMRGVKTEVRSTKDEERNTEEGGKNVNGKVLVTADRYPVYRYGDELRFECALEAPEAFDGFAYDRYLARYDIYSVCYYPKIEKIRAGQGNPVYAALFRLKERLYTAFDRGLPEPASSFGRALILGDKKGMGEELKDAFARSGLSHLAAISGDCISIIAAMVMWTLLAFGAPRRYAFYLASVFLLLYVSLIGAPASAMRAGLMGFLVLSALHLGRLNKITNALALAAAIMLVLHPRLLRDDVGFQLSFLAILGLVYVYPLFSKRLERFRPLRRGLPKLFAGILAMTLAAQVFTWPIIAVNFSQVSLVSPLANLLVIWALPFTLAAGFGGMFLSLLYLKGAMLFLFPAWLFLSYIIRAAEFTAGLPYSVINVEYIWPGWLVLYYTLASAVVWRGQKRLLLAKQ